MLTKEERREGFHYIWWAVIFITFIFLLGTAAKIFLFPAAVLNTAANSAKGVIDKTLDSNNVIVKYEWFHDANAQRDSRINQIKAHSDILAGTTDAKEKTMLLAERAAMQQSCRDLTTSYNANSQKVNVSIFKGNSLPVTLNITDCEVQ